MNVKITLMRCCWQHSFMCHYNPNEFSMLICFFLSISTVLPADRDERKSLHEGSEAKCVFTYSFSYNTLYCKIKIRLKIVGRYWEIRWSFSFFHSLSHRPFDLFFWDTRSIWMWHPVWRFLSNTTERGEICKVEGRWGICLPFNTTNRQYNLSMQHHKETSLGEDDASKCLIILTVTQRLRLKLWRIPLSKCWEMWFISGWNWFKEPPIAITEEIHHSGLNGKGGKRHKFL